MRRLRVKEFHNENWNADMMKTQKYYEDYKSKELSAAHFVMRYLETTSNRSYQQYFAAYSDRMFAQVSIQGHCCWDSSYFSVTQIFFSWCETANSLPLTKINASTIREKVRISSTLCYVVSSILWSPKTTKPSSPKQLMRELSSVWKNSKTKREMTLRMLHNQTRKS